MNKINLAIIGSGRIAGHHIKAIKKYKEIKIVSICDLDIDKAKKYANKEISIYKNYHQMLLENNNINCVAIMTPSGMHFNHAYEIIKKYKKNVIIEKPVVLRIDQLKKLYILAKKKKCKIFPVFQNRYNKAVQRVLKSIQKKEIGEINIVNVRVRWCRTQTYYDRAKWRGTYSHDGGVLTNQGIHHIDLLRFLGGEVKKVFCKMRTFGSKIQVEDTATASLLFNNGALGTIEVSTAVRPKDYEASISILGSKGSVQIGGIAVNQLEQFSMNQKDIKKFSEKIPDAYGFGHYGFYRDVIKSLTTKKKFPIDFHECLQTLKLLHSFYYSSEKNQEILVSQVKNSLRLGEDNKSLSKFYTYGK